MTATAFQSWREVPDSFWHWANFRPEEFACKADGSLIVVPEFMDRLQGLRYRIGLPFVVVSGYRTPAYNASVSTTGQTGPHTTGRAVDIRISGPDAYDVLKAAPVFGFSGLGVKQHGPFAGRFLHLDDLDGDKRPRIWTYGS